MSTNKKTVSDVFNSNTGGWSVNVPIYEEIAWDDWIKHADEIPNQSTFADARKSGEYIGSYEDYFYETLSDMFGLEGYYDKPTGYMSKGAMNEDYLSSLSEDELKLQNDRYNKSQAKLIAETDITEQGLNNLMGDAWDYYGELYGDTGSTGMTNPSGSSVVTGTNGVTIGSGGNLALPGTSGGTLNGAIPTVSASANSSLANVLSQLLGTMKSDGYDEQISKSISDLEADYRKLYGTIENGDYTKTPYYQTILDSYGISGENASNAAEASGAAANGGNLDSYAAANAARQQLAFKNAAQNAALSAYNTDITNMLKTLSDMGVYVGDLYDSWGNELDSQRTGAVNTLLGQLGAETDRYVSDNNLAADKYASDAQLQAAQTQAATDKYLAELQAKTESDKLASQEKIAQLEYELQKLDTEKKYATEERKAEIEKEATIIKAEIDAETSKYMADKDYDKYIDSANSVGKTETEKSENSANANLLAPTTAMKTAALKAYNSSGDLGLEQYFREHPGYDHEAIYNYVMEQAEIARRKADEEAEKAKYTASGKLYPTDAIYSAAMSAYKSGGVPVLETYLATIPDYDRDEIYAFINENA